MSDSSTRSIAAYLDNDVLCGLGRSDLVTTRASTAGPHSIDTARSDSVFSMRDISRLHESFNRALKWTLKYNVPLRSDGTVVLQPRVAGIRQGALQPPGDRKAITLLNAASDLDALATYHSQAPHTRKANALENEAIGAAFVQDHTDLTILTRLDVLMLGLREEVPDPSIYLTQEEITNRESDY